MRSSRPAKALTTLVAALVAGVGVIAAPAATASGRASAPAGHLRARTSIISVDAMGRPADGYHGDPFWVSEDGRYVGFSSSSADLVPGDTNERWDLFIRDRRRDTTRRIAIDSYDAHLAGSMSMSPDGRHLAFASGGETLVPGDTNDMSDAFVRDLRTGRTSRVSVSGANRQADGASEEADISADGRYVAFSSQATNLVPGDTNGEQDIFVRDVRAGSTRRVSLSSVGRQADERSSGPLISADGRYVAFSSMASTLVAGDRNGTWDVFVRDLRTGTTTRVSVSGTRAGGNGASYGRAMSRDGRYVAFFSDSSNLVPGDTNRIRDMFLRDLRTGATSRVSVPQTGRQANADSDGASISADGRFVAFRSFASNLVPGDTNGDADVFVRDRWRRTTTRVSVATSGAQAAGPSGSPVMNGSGLHLAFPSYAGNLAPGDAASTADVFHRSMPPAPRAAHPLRR
ncbi:MAG TPA: hypothetical protein VF657_05790 [Actinoplanes sp.]